MQKKKPSDVELRKKFEAIDKTVGGPKPLIGPFRFSDQNWSDIAASLRLASVGVTEADCKSARKLIERDITLWRFISPDRAGPSLAACENIRGAFKLLGDSLDTEIGKYLLGGARPVFNFDMVRVGFLTREVIADAMESIRTKKSHRNLFITKMIKRWEYAGGQAKASVSVDGHEGGPLVRFIMQTTAVVGIELNEVIARERIRRHQENLKAETNSKTREEAYAFNRAMLAGGEDAQRMFKERFPDWMKRFSEMTAADNGMGKNNPR